MNRKTRKRVQDALYNYYRLLDNLEWMKKELKELEKIALEAPEISAVDTQSTPVIGGEKTSQQEQWVLWLEKYPQRKKQLKESIETTKRQILAIKATQERYRRNPRANKILQWHFFNQLTPKEFCRMHAVSKSTFYKLQKEIIKYTYEQDREAFIDDPYWQISYPLLNEDIKILKDMLKRVDPQNSDEKELRERILRW